MPVTRNDVNAPLSPHFGKASWLLVLDDEGPAEFLRNVWLNGRDIAEALVRAGCTDVVVPRAGPAAVGCLQEHGVGVWVAPHGTAPAAVPALLARRALAPAAPALGDRTCQARRN